MSSDTLRVLIGVPSGTTWQAQFAVDLISLCTYFTMQKVPTYRAQELRVANVRSSILPKNRLDIVKAALACKADYLLFLDCDHTFPRDLLHLLLAHGKPIVAANCVTKSIPSSPTARLFNPDDPQGIPVYTDARTDLEQVWRVGTGVMLIRRDVLEKIPGSAWAMKYLPGEDTFQGEDWSFCEACQELDIPIFVDHYLSRKVGHLGNFEYTHDVVGVVCNDQQS